MRHLEWTKKADYLKKLNEFPNIFLVKVMINDKTRNSSHG